MSVKLPSSRRNLDEAIKRLGTDTEEYLRTRFLIANVIVGQFLPEGVVKGGSALKLRYGNEVTRFTRDLDAARISDIEQFIDKLGNRCEAGWNGFTGRVVERDPAHPKDVPEQYVMQPYEIRISYNGKSWCSIPLEVGHNEIGDADECEWELSPDIVKLFANLGFPEPDPVPLMLLHHQIAQKLHAVSGDGSLRAHDLIDLQLIMANSEVDLPLIRETCVRLFKYRQLQAWPPTVVKGPMWQEIYNAQRGKLAVIDDIDAVVLWVNDLIGAIEAS
jgi:hypothetical protein